MKRELNLGVFKCSVVFALFFREGGEKNNTAKFDYYGYWRAARNDDVNLLGANRFTERQVSLVASTKMAENDDDIRFKKVRTALLQ